MLGLNPRSHEFHQAASQFQAVVFIPASNISIYLGWKSNRGLGETLVSSVLLFRLLWHPQMTDQPLRQRGRHQNIYAGGTVLTRKDWCHLMDLPCSSGSKESAYNAGDLGSILGLGRSSGEGNGKPLQYSCLENPWKEEPGGLQFMGSQESNTAE